MRRLFPYLARTVLFFSLFLLAQMLEAKINLPLIWNLPYRSKLFVGREEVLKTLGFVLGDNLVFVVGINGLGKSRLVLEYAHQNKDKYDIVWKFEGTGTIIEQFKELSETLAAIDNPKETLHFIDKKQYISYAKNWLRRTDRSWLIIFDDVVDTKKIFDLIPETHDQPNKHIIVTTNKPIYGARKLKLTKFKRTESLDYLKKLLKIELSGEDLNKLSEILDDHPLALKQASSYFNNVKNASVHNYVALLEKQNIELLKTEEKLVNVESYFGIT